MSIFRSIALRPALIAVLVFVLVAFKGEKDPLHKRTFTITMNEVKDGVVQKRSIDDQLTFKDGKLFSDHLFDKFGYKWIRYRINKDSVYTDSTNTEVRMLEVDCNVTDENNQTVAIQFVTEEWDIEGTVKITKNDKIKKYYDFVGREKGGKPKKEKDPNRKKLIEIQDPNVKDTVDRQLSR